MADTGKPNLATNLAEQMAHAAAPPPAPHAIVIHVAPGATVTLVLTPART